MKYIKINPDDNVAVALQDLQKGEVIEGVVLQGDVPRGHKVVLRALAAGEDVVDAPDLQYHVDREYYGAGLCSLLLKDTESTIQNRAISKKDALAHITPAFPVFIKNLLSPIPFLIFGNIFKINARIKIRLMQRSEVLEAERTYTSTLNPPKAKISPQVIFFPLIQRNAAIIQK